METKEAAQLRAQIAVMNLLRAQGLKALDSMTMRRMAQLWPEYGLRASDLRGAVARLSMRGLVRLSASGSDDRVQLTAAGACLSRNLPAWLEYKLLAPRHTRYREAHATSIALPRPAQDRRSPRRHQVSLDTRPQQAEAA